jgi:hypothetical protein
MKRFVQSLRPRDLIVLICAILIAQLSKLHSHSSEFIEANIELAFCIEYNSHIPRSHNGIVFEVDVARPVPFDLDGDGIVEAIVTPMRKIAGLHDSDELSHSEEWSLQVSDLRPLHSTRDSYQSKSNSHDHAYPIRPESLFISDFKQTTPIHITTGQIILGEATSSNKKFNVNQNVFAMESYFCGTSWGDANDKCTHACSSGLHSDCPTGETCYASTNCVTKLRVGKDDKPQKFQASNYVTNRFQGIPSIATLWSDGTVTMHGITSQREMRNDLELTELWNVNPFNTSLTWIHFIEIDLLIENDAPIGIYGGLILAARCYSFHSKLDEHDEILIYVALDLWNGDILGVRESQGWDSLAHNDTQVENLGDNDEQGKKQLQHKLDVADREEQVPLLNESQGQETFQLKDARRKEKIVHVNDCRHVIEPSINSDSNGITPHFFSHHNNESRAALKIDSKLQSMRMNVHETNTSGKEMGSEIISKHTKRSWLVKLISGIGRRYKTWRSKSNSISRKTNTVAFHNRDGVDVLMLKDGEHVCQLPLLENVYHGDLNRDGFLEHLEFFSDFMSGHFGKRNCMVVMTSDSTENRGNFTLNLCNEERDTAIFDQVKLSTANPLPVESHDRNGESCYDIVYALNNGLLTRVDIHGIIKWKTQISQYDFPSWDGDSFQHGYLSRIYFRSMSIHGSNDAAILPFVLSGDDKIALFTAGRGRLLGTATIPQVSVWKPILSDFNGDGTTDVIIVTTDGLWGYCIEIKSFGSMFLRIINVFLAVFLFLAFVISFFDNTNTQLKRSTDK